MTAYLRRAGFEIAACRLRRRPPARQLPVPAGDAARRRAAARPTSSTSCCARSGSCRTRRGHRADDATGRVLGARARRAAGRRACPARTSGRSPGGRCSTTRRGAARTPASSIAIVLSTDSERDRRRRAPAPGSRCRSCGPPALAQDDTPMLPVIEHAVDALDARAAGRRRSSCCCSRRRRCARPRTSATPCRRCARPAPIRS